MTAAYDLARARRLVLLLAAAAREVARGRGVPLARALQLTGARSEAVLLADLAALDLLWEDPSEGELGVHLYVEDGEVRLTYAALLGSRPPALSVAEAAVLRAALEPFEQEGGRAARSTVAKLRRAVPEPLRPAADALARGLDLAAPPGPLAARLQEAIATRAEVELGYSAVADAAPRRRRVEPRVLFARDGRWYLAAWSAEKAEEHLYRLDRIAEVAPTGRTFGAHRGPPLDRYARRHLFFESGAEREVTLRFRGAAARLLRERDGKRAREEGGGTVTTTTRATPGNYLLGAVLGYGGEAAVAGPPDVAQALRERVERLRALYRR